MTTPTALLEQPPKLTRVAWVDNAGITRAKAVTPRTLETTLRHGIGLSAAQQSIPMMADALVEGSGLSAMGEVRLVPDLETLRWLPWAAGHALAMGDLRLRDGSAWAHCPRDFLRRQLHAAAALGYSVTSSFENEFYLFKPDPIHGWLHGGVTLEDTNYASLNAFTAAQPFTDNLLETLEALGLEVEAYYPESGPGQQELPIAPATGLAAADRQVLFKLAVHAVAARHGLRASFAAKPLEAGVGSGCHLHLSLWRGGVNACYQADDALGLSPLAYQSIAGVLEHLPALCALSVPSVNSYRRLQPGWWAGAYASYGLDNREASLRVMSAHLLPDSTGSSANFELKTSDASANPYLALGGMIACALDGVRRSLQAPAPLETSPAALTELERSQRGIRNLPLNLEAAIAALRGDELLLAALGPELARSFLAVRSAEAAFFADETLETEISQHRFCY